MSITSEIYRLQGAKANLKTAIENKGVTVPSSATLDDYDDYVAQISVGITPTGNINITSTAQVNVTNYATAQVVDANLVASNIKKDVSILGVTGTLAGSDYNQTIQKVVRSESGGVVTYSRAEENVGAITSIAQEKYRGNTTLISALIPDTVITIGVNAFRQCTNLTYVNLERVTSIGNVAFYLDQKLNIPLNLPSLTSLGNIAFFGSGITKIESLGSITTIPDDSDNSGGEFRNCTLLTSVVLPSTLTHIGKNAFRSCSNLISVTFPTSIETLGAACFYDCPKLTGVLNLPNLRSLGDVDFLGCSLTGIQSLGSITTIPDGDGVFRNCKLTTVVLPDTLTYIGSNAFRQNTGSGMTITINALTPPTLGANVFFQTTINKIYVPASSVATYQAASGWSDFASKIQAIA